MTNEDPGEPGSNEARLEPCPGSPNCVSTQADESDKTHYVEPIPYRGDRDALLEFLVRWIEAQPRTVITERSTDTIRAVFRSRLFRFPDDVVLVFPAGTGIVHLRSASRLGQGDLGVNRGRYRRIRSAVEQWQREEPGR